MIAGQDSVRERCSKACYSVCPRRSASVRPGSRISVDEPMILAVGRGPGDGFKSLWGHYSSSTEKASVELRLRLVGHEEHRRVF